MKGIKVNSNKCMGMSVQTSRQKLKEINNMSDIDFINNIKLIRTYDEKNY